MDGVDAVLGQFDNGNIRFEHHVHFPYSPDVVNQLQSLCVPGSDEIDRMGKMDNAVADCFAKATHALLAATNLTAGDITAIGSHGQTIRHRPNNETESNARFTLQIGNPHWIAERTQIPVVADFRRKDMLLGGHGAPLAPAFHQAWLAPATHSRVVLNLGGIANITLLPGKDSDLPVTGFDTGPANALIDAWYCTHHVEPSADSFDRDGLWAHSGSVIQPLLATLLSDRFFAQAPPKSTGKEYFNLAWVNQMAALGDFSPADVQATLQALTVESVADAVKSCNDVKEVILCGGGAFNRSMIAQLQSQLPFATLRSSLDYGLDPMQVEGMAFAWLAHQFWHRKTGNLPSVTGASKSAILGALYLPN